MSLLASRSARGWCWGPRLRSALVVTALACLARTAHASAIAEYDLKAAFLFNFTQFVEWPVEAFSGATEPFTIGILGDDPFGHTLDEVVAGETVRNRKLVVRRYRTVEQIEACHILFISSSETSRLGHIIERLGRRSVLTVGETRDFTTHSGMIAFDLSKRRLRLRVNVAAATDAGLTISSKLLRQAERVGPKR